MKKLLLLYLLILTFSSMSYAYEYVITGKGIYFYDRASTMYEDQWNILNKDSMYCENKNIQINDPNSGSGILYKECFNPYSPIGYCYIKTFDFDQSDWAHFKIIKKLSNGFVSICDRVYVEDRPIKEIE